MNGGSVWGAAVTVASIQSGEGSILHVIAFVLATALGAYTLWNGSTNLLEGYRIWAAEPTPAATVGDREGPVEVRGTVEPLDETVSGRFSGLPVLVQEWEKRRDGSDGPVGGGTPEERPLSAGREDVPFLVRDDSGTVAVDPSDAGLSLERDRENTSHDIRQIEARLEPGDDVYVFGRVRRAVDSDAKLGDEAVCVGAGDAPDEFRITDTEPDSTVVRLAGTGAIYALVGLLVTAAFGIATMAALGLP